MILLITFLSSILCLINKPIEEDKSTVSEITIYRFVMGKPDKCIEDVKITSSVIYYRGCNDSLFSKVNKKLYKRATGWGDQLLTLEDGDFIKMQQSAEFKNYYTPTKYSYSIAVVFEDGEIKKYLVSNVYEINSSMESNEPLTSYERNVLLINKIYDVIYPHK